MCLSTSSDQAGGLVVGSLWLGIVVKWLVPVFTSGNVGGVVTGHGDIVEDKAGWATRIPWFLSVEADVKQLAIGWVGEGWVDVVEAIHDLSGGVGIATESVR